MALHDFAASEEIDVSKAGSIYLDQVADRMAGTDRVEERVTALGLDPAGEIAYLVARSETGRVLLPDSLQRLEPAAYRRLTATRP